MTPAPHTPTPAALPAAPPRVEGPADALQFLARLYPGAKPRIVIYNSAISVLQYLRREGAAGYDPGDGGQLQLAPPEQRRLWEGTL